ncbi:MAG TPA: hypothetical protein ENJ60_07530 [Aeromonadales bacterium]|nr:hypothetical protein [Aeromonadales bacterium]
MNMLIRLVLLFILFLTSQSGIAAMNTFTEHQYDVNHIVLGDEIYSYDTSSNPWHCCLTPSSVNTQDRSFLAFASDFLAAKNTKLFRAISETEFKQVQKTGRFEAGPNSLGGKFFAESVDDAKRWGDVLNGTGKSRIIETQLPKNIADGLQRWERLDGIGHARYGELNR